MKNFTVQEKNSHTNNLLNYSIEAQTEQDAMEQALANARKRNADLDDIGGDPRDMASTVIVGSLERFVHG